LRRLQGETGMATVLVTHDPTEAALLAGEVLVLVDGRVVQAGAQRTVFAHPASPTAAALLGVRNIATGRVVRDGDGTRLHANGVRVPMDGYRGDLDAAMSSVSWCIRPEDVRLVDHGGIPSIVRDIVHLGSIDEVTISLAGKGELTLCTPAEAITSIGAHCQVELPPEAITVWPTDHVDVEVDGD
ncbi:MAG: TOBE domain-containing protein, partial [Sciscionella sp.]|nr:TOBE domain-containing protein [Sciscionella sp.]